MNGTPGGILSVFNGAVRYSGLAIDCGNCSKLAVDEPARNRPRRLLSPRVVGTLSAEHRQTMRAIQRPLWIEASPAPNEPLHATRAEPTVPVDLTAGCRGSPQGC